MIIKAELDACLDIEERHVMEPVERELFRLGCPGFAGSAVGREILQGLQSSAEAVGVAKGIETLSELDMDVVAATFDDCFIERSVHMFDLAVNARMAQ